VEVLNPARKSGLCIQGSGSFPWGSGPTVAILGYIVFPGHVTALEPSSWWGQVFVRHATKDSRMDIAPTYYSNGYPFSRVLTQPISVKFLCINCGRDIYLPALVAGNASAVHRPHSNSCVTKTPLH
jgi:hypothetical protein